jgi:nucleoid-associated protein YgaU
VATTAPVVGAPTVQPATAVARTTPAPTQPVSVDPKPAAKPATYTVKQGDTLAGIWRTISGSERGWQKLQEANPGISPNTLKIGQVLKVPDASPAAAPARAPAAAAATTLHASGTGESTKAETGNGTYTVVAGDTLSRISSKVFGDSKHWKQIYEANKDTIGADPKDLKIGQVLKVPAKSGKAAKAGTTGTAPSTTASPSAGKPTAGAAESKPAPTTQAPAPRAPAPPGTIGAAGVSGPAGTPAPR